MRRAVEAAEALETAELLDKGQLLLGIEDQTVEERRLVEGSR